MFPIVQPETPIRRITGVIRSNPGPLALAATLFLAARISQVATHDAEVRGLTTLAVVEVVLIVAAHALATVTGCWAVLSGGRPAGFRGLAALPRERLPPFLVYATIFNLWFLVLAAILGRIAQAMLPGQHDMVVALVVGGVTATTLLLMYVQLGFLFPDVVLTGKSGIIFAMALGLASARRVVGVLALPVCLLVFPQAFVSAAVFGDRAIAQTAAAWPSFGGTAAAITVAALWTVATTACAVAITALYQDMTQRLPAGIWR